MHSKLEIIDIWDNLVIQVSRARHAKTSCLLPNLWVRAIQSPILDWHGLRHEGVERSKICAQSLPRPSKIVFAQSDQLVESVEVEDEDRTIL